LGSTVGQLKCAGVVAAVTISRVAYPNRLTHENTMERFLCLSEKSAEFDEDEDSQNAVTRLMVELLGSFDLQNKKGERVSAFACGKSRIYFKTGALEQLEARRMAKLGVLASSIQRSVRCFIAKSVFTRLKTTAINMQALARRNIARSGLLEAQAATTMLSCWIRIVFAKAKLVYLRRNKACITIQTRCRIVIASNYLNKCKLDAVAIQKIWRGALQRPKLVIMLEEAREDARVNSKLSALQKRLQDAEMKWIKAEKARIAAEKRAESGMSTPKSSPSIVTDFPNQEEKKDEQNDDQMALIDESTK
jgi:myosin-5